MENLSDHAVSSCGRILGGTFTYETNSRGGLKFGESSVVFDGCAETIPAGFFVRDADDEGFEFKGIKGTDNISQVEIRDYERFTLKARVLDLNGLDFDTPVTLSLEIGNDRGDRCGHKHNSAVCNTRG